MTTIEPVAELEPQFSSPDAWPVAWEQVRESLAKAEVYLLSTMRPDGRPHVTPLVTVWLDEAVYFCTGTGPGERKRRNLAHNRYCVIMTGCNSLSGGLDLVVEGAATRVSDEAELRRVADVFSAKYGAPFRFTVRAGAFLNEEGGEDLVYEIILRKAFGFGKGGTFCQTRWRF